MKPREFSGVLDEAKILAALRAAESGSSGEIRVFVSRHRVADPLAAAELQFRRLGMNRTRQRNGVLIFVAPASQTFAIYGDTAIHDKCGEEFWQAVRDEMAGRLREGQHTTALVQAIGKAGEILARHFPREREPRNELPDEIARD